jgi:hypothetical protein
VPSGWIGPSHLLITSPPYMQPALAGAAEAISAPAVNAAASPATMNVLMGLSFVWAGQGTRVRCRLSWGGTPLTPPTDSAYVPTAKATPEPMTANASRLILSMVSRGLR